MKNIEVELRSFISPEKYSELLQFFNANAKLIKQDYQETYYFDTPEDLRIQKNNAGCKVWLKKGKLHDPCREEVEIKLPPEAFEKLEQLFKSLGYGIEIKWLRDRKQFEWQGIKVCLDNTKGYGHILELEKLSSPENQQSALDELKQKFRTLNLDITPKEIFEQKFNHYKQNWKQLIST